MTTEQEILDELEKAIQNTNRSNDDLLRVFENDENTDVTLRDGEVVPSLDKRIDLRVKAIGEDYIQQLDEVITDLENKSTVELQKLEDAIDTIVVDNGVPDSVVVTWSGRTQEEKNKEKPSPFDFNAKGDGITNDNQSFVDLESSYNGQVIDLLGKTYKVNQDFTGNSYINGSLRVINSNIGKGRAQASSSKYQKANGNGQKLGEVICPLTDATVGTGTTIVQSAYYSQAENKLYTQRSILNTETDETCIVEAFDYANIAVSAPPVFTSKPLNFVGHQSIALQRTPIVKFWATASKTTKGSEKAKFVVRFNLDMVSGEASNIEYMKVFGDDFASGFSGANVMSISPNGQFLVVTGNRASTGRYVRVFKTSVFSLEGDYSDKFLYEFGFQFFEGFNPQSICCDDEFIYVLHGGTTGQEKVEIYTLDGSFVDLDEKFTVGWYDASLITHQYYEPESLFVGDNGRLLCCLAAGKKAGGDVRGSFTNIISDVLFTSTRIRRTDGTRPLYYLDAQRTYSHTTSKPITYHTINPDGTYQQYKLQNKSTVSYSTINNDGFQHRLNCSGTGQPQYRVTNSLADGMLQASSTGGFGLYDIKNSNWLIQSVSGKAQIQQPLQLINASVYADNTTAKAGGLVVGDLYRTATGQLMIVY